MLLGYRKYCWAWDRIYIKANGRVPCWCDTGEKYTILDNREYNQLDFVPDILNHEYMREMRIQVLNRNKYFIRECATCCCMVDENRGKHFRFGGDEKPDDQANSKADMALRYLEDVHKNRDWPYGSIDDICEIQLEPSFPCNLRCGGCLQGLPEPLKTESPPYVFPYEWFTKTIDSINDHSVTLRQIRFVGRGEPTLNKKFADMLTYVNRIMPDTRLGMDTNANQEFKHEYLLMDAINCSIDGVTQNSYEKYRIGGVLDKAFKFMETAAFLTRKYETQGKIVWKYILFDVNDTLEELNEAQRLSKQLGIHELRLVMTHAGSFDRKVNPSSRFQSMEQLQTYIRENPIFQGTTGAFAT